jgi:ribosome assembly protein RRB1
MAPKKRSAAADDESPAAKSAVAPSAVERSAADDEGMGEFEDQWEDDLEEDGDEGEVVDGAEDDEEDGDKVDEEGMEVVYEEEEDEPLEGEEEEDPDEQARRAPSPVPFLPTDKLEEGEFLQPDLSTYPLLHSFVPTWPSLSFDILRDGGGEERRGYPVSCALVAGTQAQDKTGNEITIMRWEGLGRTRKDENGELIACFSCRV